MINKSITTQISISLAIVGTTYGMYLNHLFPISVGWSPLIMTITVLFSMNWKYLYQLYFPSKTPILKYIILFQLIMLSYGVFSENLTSQLFSFHLYVIIFSISLMSISPKMNFSKFPYILYTVSLPCLILGAYFSYQGLISGEEYYIQKRENENFALEAFTTSMGVLVNVFSSFCMNKNTIFRKILFIISIGLGTYILLAIGKRTPFFVLIIGVATYLYMQGILRFKLTKHFFKYAVLITTTIIGLYFTNKYFAERINSFCYNFYTGFLNLLGDTSVSDTTGSAIARTQYREYAYNYMNEHFSSYNYIFGGGYNIKWIDNPLLQSYLDMGIIGFLFYLNIVILYPLKVLRNKNNNPIIIIGVLLCLYAIVSVFNSGNQYQFIKYIPVCILSFFFCKENKFKKKHINK